MPMSCRSVLVAAVLASLLPVSSAAEEPPCRVRDLGWMTGAWLGALGAARIEEVWLAPAGDAMLGINRSVAGGRQTAFELLRIESDDGAPVYLASPGGRCPPTRFPNVECGARRIVFANPDHDFPQRIIYWREGDVLHARIEGTEGGTQRSAQWNLSLETGL